MGGFNIIHPSCSLEYKGIEAACKNAPQMGSFIRYVGFTRFTRMRQRTATFDQFEWFLLICIVAFLLYIFKPPPQKWCIDSQKYTFTLFISFAAFAVLFPKQRRKTWFLKVAQEASSAALGGRRMALNDAKLDCWGSGVPWHTIPRASNDEAAVQRIFAWCTSGVGWLSLWD